MAADTITVSIPKVFTVEVPFDKGVEQQSRHIDIQLTTSERLKLSAIYHGLRKADAKLTTGRNVANINDVVRYLIQNLDFPKTK